MRLLSRAEFGKLFNPPISRQAVDDACKRGALDIIEQDGKKYIDADAYKSVQYLKRDNSQRKGNKLPVNNINVEEDVKVDVKKSARIELPREDLQDDDPEEYNAARTEKLKQDIIKLKLQNAYKEGSQLDREKVYNSVFLFFDKLFSNLERLADTYLSDVANKIISKNELTPEIRQSWIDAVLEQIDNAKQEEIRRLEEIKRKQHG